MSSRLPGYGSGSGYGYGAGGRGGGYDAAEMGREPGGRRKKLAAMAGKVYNAGASAVNEIKESYTQTRAGHVDTPETAKITIPGSFPDVAIVSNGKEQMVLFPSYAKRHIKSKQRRYANPGGPPGTASMGIHEEDYWRQEWARHEDEKAVCDVDVRGWIYFPHKGAMTRKNKMLIGLARHLSGIPVPKLQQSDPAPSLTAIHRQHEEEREEARIAREAQEIERIGMGEKEVAQKGGYSEPPKDEDSEEDGSGSSSRHRSRAVSPMNSRPSSPKLGRSATTGGTELTEAELAVANANLMARLGPFLTTPQVQLPITVFFYNDTQSQSRTVETNDAGHFVLRAPLEFVPTHVRVLVCEGISATERVHIIESKGISMISDIDDTIKHSNISLGAKEIFRNTFVRELADLTVPGVRDWYSTLHDMGVSLHYCSNSPWQLYPVIASYFKLAGLPPGSIHLKQYSGMLQGIFEPVAERKKGTLEKIMHDFPERKFLLVGDSGEADLEVYTDIAVSNPGRIIAIFIRDVTTPDQAGYFDSAFDGHNIRSNRKIPNVRDKGNGDNFTRPALPPRTMTEPPMTSPVGDLVDFAEEPEQMKVEDKQKAQTPSSNQGLPFIPKVATDMVGKKAPPPRPVKPTSLQSSPAAPTVAGHEAEHGKESKKPPPLPPPPRKSTPSSGQSSKTSTPHPLAQIQNSSDQMLSDSQRNLQQPRSNPQLRSKASFGGFPNWSASKDSSNTSKDSSKVLAPPPPPPRRRGTPNLSLSPRLMTADRHGGSNADVDVELLPPPSSMNFSRTSTGNLSPGRSPRGSPRASPNGSPTMGPTSKKVDLWRIRVQRAHDTLRREGVQLYTWKRGEDVIVEAVGIAKEKMREMGLRPERRRED